MVTNDNKKPCIAGLYLTIVNKKLFLNIKMFIMNKLHLF